MFSDFFPNFCKIAYIICNPVFEINKPKSQPKLRLRLRFIYFVGYFCRLFCKSLRKKNENMGWPFLKICLAKEMQYIINFYAHVHACSPSYTDEE